MDDQPVPEGEDHRVLARGYVNARVVPAHALVEEADYAVPRFDQLVIDLDGFPGDEPLSPPPKRGLYSPVDPGEVRQWMSRGIPFDFRIPEFDPGPRERGFPVELARITTKGIDSSPQSLHVLLRHHLSLEPHGFEGLLRISKGSEADQLSVTELQHPAGGRLRFDSAASAPVVNPTNQHRDLAHRNHVVHIGHERSPRRRADRRRTVACPRARGTPLLLRV